MKKKNNLTEFFSKNCDARLIWGGDETVKKRDIKKIKKEAGKTFDGVSRPSNDEYREEYNRIFGEWKSSEE